MCHQMGRLTLLYQTVGILALSSSFLIANGRHATCLWTKTDVKFHWAEPGNNRRTNRHLIWGLHTCNNPQDSNSLKCYPRGLASKCTSKTDRNGNAGLNTTTWRAPLCFFFFFFFCHAWDLIHIVIWCYSSADTHRTEPPVNRCKTSHKCFRTTGLLSPFPPATAHLFGVGLRVLSYVSHFPLITTENRWLRTKASTLLDENLTCYDGRRDCIYKHILTTRGREGQISRWALSWIHSPKAFQMLPLLSPECFPQSSCMP